MIFVTSTNCFIQSPLLFPPLSVGLPTLVFSSASWSGQLCAGMFDYVVQCLFGPALVLLPFKQDHVAFVVKPVKKSAPPGSSSRERVDKIVSEVCHFQFMEYTETTSGRRKIPVSVLRTQHGIDGTFSACRGRGLRDPWTVPLVMRQRLNWPESCSTNAEINEHRSAEQRSASIVAAMSSETKFAIRLRVPTKLQSFPLHPLCSCVCG